jgi:hypothetical protein
MWKITNTLISLKLHRKLRETSGKCFRKPEYIEKEDDSRFMLLSILCVAKNRNKFKLTPEVIKFKKQVKMTARFYLKR